MLNSININRFNIINLIVLLYYNLIHHSHWDLQGACFLGVDIDDGQLRKANENIEFAELGNRIHLLKASSMSKKCCVLVCSGLYKGHLYIRTTKHICFKK